MKPSTSKSGTSLTARVGTVAHVCREGAPLYIRENATDHSDTNDHFSRYSPTKKRRRDKKRRRKRRDKCKEYIESRKRGTKKRCKGEIDM